MLRQASGLGEAARACHDTIKAAGLPVYGVDLTRRFVQDTDFPSFTFADGGGLRGAGLCCCTLAGRWCPWRWPDLVARSYAKSASSPHVTILESANTPALSHFLNEPYDV
jgi:hypothetical protein